MSDISRAWNGQSAQYVSPTSLLVEGYGFAPHSELGMAMLVAGERVIQYALWADKTGRVIWAKIRVFPFSANAADSVRIEEGLPGEVLPDALRRVLGGFGQERIPLGVTQ